MKTLRYGLIGCGMMGKGHTGCLEVLAGVPFSLLVGQGGAKASTGWEVPESESAAGRPPQPDRACISAWSPVRFCKGRPRGRQTKLVRQIQARVVALKVKKWTYV